MEFLKEHVGDELYAQLEEKLKGKDIELVNAKDGSYLPRTKFNEVNEENKGLKAQLKERDTQLKTLAKDTEASAELKTKITELQDANKKAEATYKETLAGIKKDYAVKEALKDAKNPATVMPLLNLDEIKLGEDGKLTGIDAQLEAIKQDNGYLFNTPGATPPGTPGANPGAAGATTPAGKYLEDYQAAQKAGDIPRSIAIKQEAFSNGIEI